jgi:hypothetical protein
VGRQETQLLRRLHPPPYWSPQIVGFDAPHRNPGGDESTRCGTRGSVLLTHSSPEPRVFAPFLPVRRRRKNARRRFLITPQYRNRAVPALSIATIDVGMDRLSACSQQVQPSPFSYKLRPKF